MADTIVAAVQAGTYPTGADRLKSLYEQVQKGDDKALAAYVKFKYLTAEYGQSLQAPNADFTAIQQKWLENLEAYVNDYPSSDDAAEAMLQLGIGHEFAGQEEKAKKWYGQILANFKTSAPARKAEGAATRLDSVGKSIVLKGKSLRGDSVDLAKLRGKVVLVHYWATWCEPCKADLAQLKELQAKYGKSGFALIGISLDSSDKALLDYLQKNPLPWPQIYEPGGLDSRLANEMGILTLPTMLLIDDRGVVVNRSIHITELDGELKKMLKQ
jgi:thiol-disulfide isomerase/thioredoxin